ncbi:hypothetical protein DW190_17690 [Bacteroides caccae]|uniref:Uncharacterized protein n=1 Tax=Bacteroides caccae TaxID=47678 RepID=A0A414YKT5_9BACE|nr:hypothetical protein DW190_17690 [Bacteroides caccae]
MKIPGSYCFRGFSFYIPGKLQFLTGEQFLDREEKEVRLRNKKEGVSIWHTLFSDTTFVIRKNS